MPGTAPDAALPPRLRWLIEGVLAFATPVVVGAGVTLVVRTPSKGEAAGILLFLALALLAELKPVSLDEDDLSTVSLAFVFILASLMLFGWAPAVLTATISVLVPQLLERRPPVRMAFNTGVYALSAFAAAVPVFLAGGALAETATVLTLYSFVGGAAFVAVNLVFVSLALSLHQRVPLRPLLVNDFRHAGPAFVVMAFLAALAAVLWHEDPRLLVLLAGPLFTLTLYQRSSLASKIATRDAHTDSLTRLGNLRSYELQLAELLDEATEQQTRVCLCLVDVDDFKSINDTFGHPVGDRVLLELAQLFRNGDDGVRAYRFGGDEFALALDCDETTAYRHVEDLHRRISETQFASGEPVTISVGLATFPEHARTAEDLQRVSDGALYHAKLHGKNRSCIYSPNLIHVYSPGELERRAERQARLRASENLVRVVDAKDAYTGQHSERVANLVEGIAREIGFDDDVVAQLSLAGLLHDLGKIAISDRILAKPGRLTPEEERVVRTHPELGYSLLDGLEITPVDTWIRHHHEHWDGSGYPDGLAGEEIPVGSRIILVADAFDAITTERSYRAASTVDEAVAELQRQAGAQFDAAVVRALESVVGVGHATRLRLVPAPTRAESPRGPVREPLGLPQLGPVPAVLQISA